MLTAEMNDKQQQDKADAASAPSAYYVLARKYRPRTFSELIGQEVLTRVIAGALRQQRVHHAYILAGVRGVGKTTSARLLAAVLNCQRRAAGDEDACGKCDSCKDISVGRHVDVIEFDAASHTGIDDIRELIDAVAYRPAVAQYKVYIIDEVHMLSDKAFNALLKTLEEPPPQVVFIFATTEVRQIPATILSRCMRFDLRRVTQAELSVHLAKIAKLEQYSISKAAAELLAASAGGSVRDGLSLLDQACAVAVDRRIEAGMINSMLGLADPRQLHQLLVECLQGDAAAAIEQVRELIAQGLQAEQITLDILQLVHDATEVAINPALAGNSSWNEARQNFTREYANKLSVDQWLRIWQILQPGYRDVSQSPVPELALEMLLLKLLYAAKIPAIDHFLQLDHDANLAAATQVDLPAGKLTNPQLNQVDQSKTTSATDTSLRPATVSSTSVPLTDTAEEASNQLQPPSSEKLDREGLISELLAQLHEKRHIILANNLKTMVHIVSIVPGKLVLQRTSIAETDIVNRIRNELNSATDGRWQVSEIDVATANAPPTIDQLEQQQQQSKLEQYRRHQVVSEIEQQLPFTLTEVIEKE